MNRGEGCLRRWKRVLCCAHRHVCIADDVVPATPQNSRKCPVSRMGSPISTRTFVEGCYLHLAVFPRSSLHPTSCTKPLLKIPTCLGVSVAPRVGIALVALTPCPVCAAVSYLMLHDSVPCLGGNLWGPALTVCNSCLFN